MDVLVLVSVVAEPGYPAGWPILTLYPVIGELPALDGAVHERATVVSPGVAASPVGTPGTDPGWSNIRVITTRQRRSIDRVKSCSAKLDRSDFSSTKIYRHNLLNEINGVCVF